MASAAMAEVERARQAERTLQNRIDQLRQEKTDEAKRLASVHAADIERLRQRPQERASASGVPEGASAGVGCTGAGLARPDAEFLVWFGADAARLQLALDQCVAQYAEVERALSVASMAGSKEPD